MCGGGERKGEGGGERESKRREEALVNAIAEKPRDDRFNRRQRLHKTNTTPFHRLRSVGKPEGRKKGKEELIDNGSVKMGMGFANLLHCCALTKMSFNAVAEPLIILVKLPCCCRITGGNGQNGAHVPNAVKQYAIQW
jgi:hypothetical protein